MYVLYNLEIKEKIYEIYNTICVMVDVCLVCAKMPAIWLYNFLLRFYETRDQLLPRLIFELKSISSSIVSTFNTLYALKICYFNLLKACVSYYVNAYYFLILTTVKTSIISVISTIKMF